MGKKVIKVPDAPALPFSPGIKAGDFIFVSGQVAYENPATGEEIKGIKAQTRQCLEGAKQILLAAGSSLDDVVKVNVYLKHAEDFSEMNEVYRSYFTEDQPARTTVVPNMVMPKVLVEIECIAYSP